MFLRVLLASFAILVILASAEARLEFCACCKEQTGQPISKKCHIPARSVNEEELKPLKQICIEREAISKRFYMNSQKADYYYRSYYDSYKNQNGFDNLNHIVYNKSMVSYLPFPESDCEATLNSWKDSLFWIPGHNAWTLTSYDGLLSRKTVVLNGTNETLYQMMAKQASSIDIYSRTPLRGNPSLNSFNGTYEVLLRIIPHLQTLHGIEYVSEKIQTEEPTVLGTMTLGNFNAKEFVFHFEVSEQRSYDLDGNFSRGSEVSVEDGNETLKTNIGYLTSYTSVKAPTLETEYEYVFFSKNIIGQWEVVEKNFTSKLTTVILDSNPRNSLLETEVNVTGTKIERSIQNITFEYTEDHDYSVFVDLSDRVAAGMLFTLAGVIILGIILFACKKCFCCCFRDRVTTGYQRLDETRTGTRA